MNARKPFRPTDAESEGFPWPVYGLESIRLASIAFVVVTLWTWYRLPPVDLVCIPLVLLGLSSGAVLLFAGLYASGYLVRNDLSMLYGFVGDSQSGPLVLLLLLVCVVSLVLTRTHKDPHPLAPHFHGFRESFRPIVYVIVAIKFAALLFTTLDPINTIAWLAIGAIILRGLRPGRAANGTRTPVMHDLGAAALLVVSSVVTYIALELGLWAVLGPPPAMDKIYRAHAPTLFMPRPNSTAVHSFETNEGSYKTIATNVGPQGFRNEILDQKEPDEFRILLLGDSYTMGFTVDESDTISSQLEALLGERYPDRAFTVINGGLHGTGPIQQYGMLVEYGLPLDPDLVILQTFPGNDWENSLALTTKVFEAYQEQWTRWVRFYHDLRHWNYGSEYWLQNHLHGYRAVVNAYGGEPYVQRLANKLRFIQAPARLKFPPPVYRPAGLEIDLIDRYDVMEEAIATFRSYVSNIRDRCEREGIPFAAYCVPRIADLDDGEWDELLASAPDPTLYSRRRGLRTTETSLREEGIRVLHVHSTLAAYDETADIYYLEDGHCTPEGNRAIARVLLEYTQTMISEDSLHSTPTAQ